MSVVANRRVPRVSGGERTVFDKLRADCKLSVCVESNTLSPHNTKCRKTQQVPTVAGGTTVSLDSNLGPVLDFDGTGDRLAYANHTWAANSDATMAWIGRLDAAAANDAFMTTRGAVNQGLVFGQISTGTGELRLTKGGVVSIDSGIVPTATAPYFAAVSYRHSTGAVRFVAMRLDTNVLSTANQTNSTAYTAGDGTFTIGGDQNFATDSDMVIAAAYIGTCFLDTADLTVWARNPFGFWEYTAKPHESWARVQAAATLRANPMFGGGAAANPVWGYLS